MPTWRTELPPEGRNHGYTLRRTPANGSLTGIVTSEELLVCDTHYWHARTMPCERECNAEGKTIDDSKCQACVDKAAWRTHVYLSVFDVKKQEHFIFECTTVAAKPLKEYREAVGTLRGCIINASRKLGKVNGAVTIITNTANLSRTPIPNGPDVPDALAVIWRLPRTAIEMDREKRKQSRVKINGNRMEAMRNQPDNACDPVSMADIIGGNGHALKLPSKA